MRWLLSLLVLFLASLLFSNEVMVSLDPPSQEYVYAPDCDVGYQDLAINYTETAEIEFSEPCYAFDRDENVIYSVTILKEREAIGKYSTAGILIFKSNSYFF